MSLTEREIYPSYKMTQYAVCIEGEQKFIDHGITEINKLKL